MIRNISKKKGRKEGRKRKKRKKETFPKDRAWWKELWS